MPVKYKLVLRKDMHKGAEVETKTATPRRCRLGVADICCGLLLLLA